MTSTAFYSFTPIARYNTKYQYTEYKTHGRKLEHRDKDHQTDFINDRKFRLQKEKLPQNPNSIESIQSENQNKSYMICILIIIPKLNIFISYPDVQHTQRFPLKTPKLC